MGEQLLHDTRPSKGARGVRVRLGTPALRGTGISELTLIARVNERIKLAIHASERVALVAVNASLAAGRAGADAAGFRVVAQDLRCFAEGMARDMAGWSHLIGGVVRETALDRTQARRLYALQATAARSPQAAAALAAACASAQEDLFQTTARNSHRVFELLRVMRRTEKQRVRGEVIARAALIEAAHSGATSSGLRQVARSMGEALDEFSAQSRAVGQLMVRTAA